MTMPRMVPVVIALCGMLVVAEGATAQSQRVFAFFGTRLVEIESNPAHLGQVLRTWSLPAAAAPQTVLSAGGGRYLLWSVGQLFVFDTVTGAVATPSLGPDIASAELVAVTDAGDQVVLSARTTDFGNRLLVWNLAGAVVRSIPLSCPRQFAYAAATHQVLVLTSASCAFGPPPPQWIDVVDLEDGTVRSRAIEVPFSSLVGIATDRSGSRLWMVAVPGYGYVSGYGLYDVSTGALRAANTSLRPEQRNRFQTPGLIVDEPRNLILTVSADGLAALDATTLAPVGRVDAPVFRLDDRSLPPGYSAAFNYSVLADPAASTWFAYEASGTTYSYHGGPCVTASLFALDPANGRVIATRDLAEIAGAPICGLQFAMTVAPPPPQRFRADVNGRQVTFGWDAAPRATHYEIEVGTAPGLRNLGVLSPDALPFVVDEVPPGVYHVRLRAVNYAGKGAYTDDLAVVVR